MSGGDVLRRLQDLDSHVSHLQHELALARAAVQRDAALDAQRQRAARARAGRDDAARDAAAAEAAFKSLDTRVHALDRRLYGGSVRNPHELLEMQRELEMLRDQLTDAETSALQGIEQAESAEAQAAAAAQLLAGEEARRDRELEPLRARVVALEAELVGATAERSAVTAQLAPRDLGLYQRVAAHHQPAVVPLQGDACGGCHLPLSIEERHAVRTGSGVMQCPNCDRILVS